MFDEIEEEDDDDEEPFRFSKFCTFCSQTNQIVLNEANLLESSAILKREISVQLKKESQLQRRLSVMMGLVVTAFLVCWMPFGFMFVSSPFNSSLESFFDKHQILVDFFTWIGKIIGCEKVIH